MKKILSLAGAIAVALALVSGTASAVEVKLVGVTYPDGKKVEVPFTKSSIAPKAAVLSGVVKFAGTQGDVRLEWEKMEPAVMFAGNITSYAVWAITRDGRPENLGELPVREKKSGKADYRTGKKNFALMVTAEVLPGTVYPSELVIFTSGKVDEKTTATNSEFVADLRFPLPGVIKPGNPSIANLSYVPGGEPIELQQARKAYEMAVQIDAKSVEPKALDAAKQQLEQATASSVKGSKKIVVDYSQRSLENSGLAIRVKVNKILEDIAAEEAARKRAMDEAKRKELEAAKAKAAAAEADKARLAAEVDRLKAERESLRQSLIDSVGKTMQITESARGVVVGMTDVVFDVNKSTLKHDSEISLAKVSAIMTVFQKFNARVEGFTDATGGDELNMKLSAERARSVADFLIAQGVQPERLAHAGYGKANPVGPNETAEGRAKNRRVEIVLSQGPVEPTPGGMTAPAKPAAAAKPAAKAAEAPNTAAPKPAAPKPEAPKAAEPKK